MQQGASAVWLRRCPAHSSHTELLAGPRRAYSRATLAITPCWSNLGNMQASRDIPVVMMKEE